MPRLRRARDADLAQIRGLLKCAGLPREGVDGALGGFVVACEDSVILGVAGLEVCASYGLLRSVAVAEHARGRGIGTSLCARCLDHARGLGLDAVFLLTEGATGFFQPQGFVALPRDRAPPAIRASAQFARLCPASSVLMMRRLD